MLSTNPEAAFRTLVGALAGTSPLPAGGAAAVVAIAMGVGLGAKVVRLSAPTQPLASRLDEILERLLPEFEADCAAFSALLEAIRRPREDAERGVAVRVAWREATAAPVSVACAAQEAESLLSECSSVVKPSMAADLDAALELVRAGRRIAEHNARENAEHLPPHQAHGLLERMRPPNHP